MYRPLFLSFLIGWCTVSVAQSTVSGTVTGEGPDGPERLVGANLIWAGTLTGASTDSLGHFQLEAPSAWPAELVVQTSAHGSARPASVTHWDPSRSQLGLRWAEPTTRVAEGQSVVLYGAHGDDVDLVLAGGLATGGSV